MFLLPPFKASSRLPHEGRSASHCTRSPHQKFYTTMRRVEVSPHLRIIQVNGVSPSPDFTWHARTLQKQIRFSKQKNPIWCYITRVLEAEAFKSGKATRHLPQLSANKGIRVAKLSSQEGSIKSQFLTWSLSISWATF